MGKTKVIQEFESVKEKHPSLHLRPMDDDAWEIFGKLHFSGKFQLRTVEDVYQIRIYVPPKYPQVLPRVWELGSRISDDYHKFSDEALCLGTSLDVKVNFHKHPNLLGFIEESIVPYFFRYSYKLKYGIFPFGDRSHGIDGVIEHYKELFSTHDLIDVVKLLGILVCQNYQEDQQCPCLSGKTIEQCHGDVLLKLLEYQSIDEYIDDFLEIERVFRFRRDLLKKNLHQYLMRINR